MWSWETIGKWQTCPISEGISSEIYGHLGPDKVVETTQSSMLLFQMRKVRSKGIDCLVNGYTTCKHESQDKNLLLLLLLPSRFSSVWLCATSQTAAHQAPPALGFSRQEHWSRLPFLSPLHESEKWKWSHSVVSDSWRPHGLHPNRLLHPWDFPGKSTGVVCHCLYCWWVVNWCSHYWKQYGSSLVN